jgi:hypothetical protein
MKGGIMPRYNVSLTRTLILSADVAVRAKNEEAAHARVEELISKGHFGTIEWRITSRSSADWEEQEDEIEIDVVREE